MDKYQTEQEQLLGQIQALETAMQEVKDNQQNAVRWAELMAQYVGIQELTAENLNLLVERIEVYDRTETNAGAEQMIKICYRFGGYIGERVFLAKVLKHTCRKTPALSKKGKAMGKYHLYLSEEERQLVLHALIDFRNKLLAAGRYTDCVDELLIKVMYAKTKKIKIR